MKLCWLAKLRSMGLAVQTAIVVAVAAAAYAAVAPVAWRLARGEGLRVAAVAAGLCLAGAVSALLAGHCFRGGKYALVDVLIGMHLRMGIPLGGGAAIYFCDGPLADAGILYYLLVFYPVTLCVEVALSLPAEGLAFRKKPDQPSNDRTRTLAL